MCGMCIREMEAAKGHLSDLILEYRQVRAIALQQHIDADDMEHIAALAHKVNQGVSEHYGVVNGHIVAVAVHQIVTGMGELHMSVDSEQVTLAVMAANEKLREMSEPLASEATAHELLSALSDLQRL